MNYSKITKSFTIHITQQEKITLDRGLLTQTGKAAKIYPRTLFKVQTPLCPELYSIFQSHLSAHWQQMRSTG